jgi:hypothetical protein
VREGANEEFVGLVVDDVAVRRLSATDEGYTGEDRGCGVGG